MNEPTAGILQWIERIRPAYARMLRCEVARMTEDGQDDRVMQALGAITPAEAKHPEASALLPEDRELLDRAKGAMDRFWAERGKAK